MGGAYEASGKLDEALSSYREARSLSVTITKKDPSNNWLQRELAVCEESIGRVLKGLNRFDEAVTAYQESFTTLKTILAKEPNNALWQTNLRLVIKSLANALLYVGKPEQALTYLDDPVHFAADDTRYLWNWGGAALYAGRAAAAADDIAAIVKFKPSTSFQVLWLHIARVRAGQDDKDEINRSLWKLPIDWPWRIVAFYAGLGTPETAMDAGQSGATDIERQSRSCDANFYVGVYQIEKGALAEARELLEAAGGMR